MRHFKKTVALVVFFVGVSLAFTVSAKWKFPTEWTYLAAYGTVFNVAKGLHKVLPLKLISASKKGKEIKFKSDFGTLDIPKDISLTFISMKKSTTVKVLGAPPPQSYRILSAIGDKLKQPLPAQPRKHRY